MDKQKKSKKSKHGKKNWRKNIDVSDIEKADNIRNQEKLDKNKIKQMKDEELFELDIKKKEFIGKKIKKKGEKEKKKKKLSKMEERKIKRIIENEKEKILLKNDKNEKKEEIYDMWENEEENNGVSNKNISYPVVPLPHPGQSYNPNKKDLNHLLKKIVELNKSTYNKEENKNKKKEINANNIFKNDDEDEEEINTSLIKISNNEPVSDLNRLTKKEKRIKEKKKINKLIDKQNFENKKLKLEIGNMKGLKKLLKERKEYEKKEEEEKKQKKQYEILKNNQLKKGIIDDQDLLEDFKIKNSNIPLRNLQHSINPLSQRWENLLKRNVVGVYSREKRKKNNKLNKIKYLDLKGDYNLGLNEDLDIIE